jgi:diguanylate cyclase
VRTSRTAAGPHAAPHRLTPRVLSGLMWLLLAAYLVGLSVHGTGFEPLVDGWLGVLTQALPAAVCWTWAARAGERRRELAFLAAGMSAFAAGNAVFVVAISRDASLPFPSSGDLGFLWFYPAALTAIAIAVRREHRTVRGAVWLDSLLGGLAAATVLAVVLSGVFAQAAGSPLQVAVALAYPLFDLLLVATAIGVLALQGRRPQRHWLVLTAGLGAFAAADVVFALRVSGGGYVVGTPLDALWALGMALFAVWGRRHALRPLPEGPGPRSEQEQEQVPLAVPALATAASLVVLNAATHVSVSAIAGTLATLTLVVTAARTHLAFRQLRRLAVLRRQATTDDLTGLPNRRAFYADAQARLEDRGTRRALLLLDLDRFKEVNDGLGHHVGDQLLVEVGARLVAELREHDLLARLGGDEFAVMLDGEPAEAVDLADRLRQVLAVPFTLQGIALRTGVSIGVALAPDHGSDLSVLLQRADIAMYKAKIARTGHRVYSEAEDQVGQNHLRTLDELRQALDRGELTLHYQPKLDLGSGEVRGVEALVRWQHPTRGLLLPDAFLPLVEGAGMMHELTGVVLRQALDQAARWHARGRPLTVAVNLSASALVDADLPAQVGDLLLERGLPATALQLEITEEFLMADRRRAVDILHGLRQRGVQIAVDDFGTGYSSLAYLRDLPIDELKLDRSFVLPMRDDTRAAALVASTIGLAHSLGLRMVAEGVEDEVTLLALTRQGCDQAQGYHLARPLPPAELDRWLDRRAADRQPGPQRAPVSVAP